MKCLDLGRLGLVTFGLPACLAFGNGVYNVTEQSELDRTRTNDPNMLIISPYDNCFASSESICGNLLLLLLSRYEQGNINFRNVHEGPYIVITNSV